MNMSNDQLEMESNMSEQNKAIDFDLNEKVLEIIQALNACTHAINAMDGRLSTLELEKEIEGANQLSNIVDIEGNMERMTGTGLPNTDTNESSVFSLEQRYASMVDQLVKPADQILLELTERHADLIHMALGVSGESGELVDAIKKFAIYGKELDRENVIEELGDLEFYTQHIRKVLGISRDEVLIKNIEKLGKRYHQGQYSDQQAQERLDKEAK